MVFANRFGHKTPAGGGSRQNIEVGRMTEECTSTDTSDIEGLSIPFVAKHKIRVATPRKDIEGIMHKLEFEMFSYLGVNQHIIRN